MWGFRHLLKFQVTLDIHIHHTTHTLCVMFHLCMCIYTWCNSHLEKKSSFILNHEWSCCPYVCMAYMLECKCTHTSTNTSIHTYKQLQAYAGIWGAARYLHMHLLIYIYRTHMLLFSSFIVLLFPSLPQNLTELWTRAELMFFIIWFMKASLMKKLTDI